MDRQRVFLFRRTRPSIRYTITRRNIHICFVRLFSSYTKCLKIFFNYYLYTTVNETVVYGLMGRVLARERGVQTFVWKALELSPFGVCVRFGKGEKESSYTFSALHRNRGSPPLSTLVESVRPERQNSVLSPLTPPLSGYYYYYYYIPRETDRYVL